MIDLSKRYRTRSGRRVILHGRVEFNSAGRRVTYPIKGSVVEKEKPLRLRYAIWTDEGYGQAVRAWGDHPDDLILEDS